MVSLLSLAVVSFSFILLSMLGFSSTSFLALLTSFSKSSSPEGSVIFPRSSWYSPFSSFEG